MITQEKLKELLDYDPEIGEFRWKMPHHGKPAGSLAGTLHHHGYISIRIKNKFYSAHRLVFLFIDGHMPPNQVDHINRVRNDNRFCNLRLATKTQNGWNKEIHKNNTSGIPGVCWHAQRNMWMVRLGVKGVRKYLGLFSSIEDAAFAVKLARKELHGEFAHHG